MLLVKIPSGRLLRVTFTHTTYKISPKGYADTFERRATICKIHELQGNESQLVSMGVVKCFWKDRIENHKGITGSLARATASLEFTKDDRAAIWDAYQNRSHGSNGGPTTPPMTMKPPKEPTNRLKVEETLLTSPDGHGITNILLHPSVLNRLQMTSLMVH